MFLILAACVIALSIFLFKLNNEEYLIRDQCRLVKNFNVKEVV